jgi:sulfur carrier protein
MAQPVGTGTPGLTDTLRLQVNDQPHAVSAGTTLGQLLDQLGMGAGQGMAVAINNSVVPRAAWLKHRLTEGDDVLVIQATQGG